MTGVGSSIPGGSHSIFFVFGLHAGWVHSDSAVVSDYPGVGGVSDVWMCVHCNHSTCQKQWSSPVDSIWRQNVNPADLRSYPLSETQGQSRSEHRKNPSQLICCTRLPLTAYKALDNVFQHQIPTAHLICCTNVIYVVQELHNIWNVLHNIWQKFTQHMTKYWQQIEIIRQHMTYFTKHIKIFYTTHVNNLYNICKKNTTHDQLLNNIWHIL